MYRAIILLTSLFGLAFSDPQIVWLYQYNADTPNTDIAVETGANLYLASNDDVASLKQISITNGGSTYTLDQMLNLGSLKIQSDRLTIKSTIPSASSATLTGYLYVTTAAQANGSSPKEAGGKTTTVVLNVGYTTSHFPPFDAPVRTTYVTEVDQKGSTPLNFHRGYPNFDYKTLTSNQFFENPLAISLPDKNGDLQDTKIFFDSVEPAQVNLPYWYITADGPYSMKLDSTYMNVPHNTTSVNTTGVFVLTDVWLEHVVNFATDPTRSGNTATLITTHLNYQANVVFSNDGGVNSRSFGAGNDLEHAQIYSNFMSKKLVINGTAVYPGELYCQYYVWSGDLLPIVPTSPAPTGQTSTTTVATTTKSSKNLNVFFSVLIFVFTLLRQ